MGSDWGPPASSSQQWLPTAILQLAGIQGDNSEVLVANFTCQVITAIDLFYYGGSTTAGIRVTTLSSKVTIVEWRPETANAQSFFYRGWVPLFGGDGLQWILESAGQFDLLVGGWFTNSPSPFDLA